MNATRETRLPVGICHFCLPAMTPLLFTCYRTCAYASLYFTALPTQHLYPAVRCTRASAYRATLPQAWTQRA